MTINELGEKLNQLSLEQFSSFIKKNYGKLLKEPKKLGYILKLYGERVMAEGNHKRIKRDNALDELLSLDLGVKGGDKRGK